VNTEYNNNNNPRVRDVAAISDMFTRAVPKTKIILSRCLSGSLGGGEVNSVKIYILLPRMLICLLLEKIKIYIL